MRTFKHSFFQDKCICQKSTKEACEQEVQPGAEDTLALQNQTKVRVQSQ